MKTVLISGINGFLGSHLAIHLKEKFRVIGIEHSLNNLYRISNENFEVFLSNDKILEQVFKQNKIYAVIHVATIYRRKKEPLNKLINTNINLPVRLVELSNNYKISIFINTDSFFNNSNFSYSYLPYYTLSKKHSLEWIKMYSNESNLKVINMKIFHMYGENDSPEKFITKITTQIMNNKKSIDLTLGQQTRDFIYVKDVVSSFEFVLNPELNLKKFQEFDVSTGHSISLKDFVSEIKKITKSKTELNFGVLPYRNGEIMVSESNNLSLVKIGWKPKYKSFKGLKKYIYALRQLNSQTCSKKL